MVSFELSLHFEEMKDEKYLVNKVAAEKYECPFR